MRKYSDKITVIIKPTNRCNLRCKHCYHAGKGYGAGSDEAFLNSLISLSPKKVVYISCNPETLARDLKYLSNNRYKAQIIQPIEMFPFTEHVETVVRLEKH